MLFKQYAGAVLVVAFFLPTCLFAQNEGPAITQEYFVQQAADEALLIRINAFEAEFESRVSSQDGNEILISGIPDSRIVPIFQYIHPQKESRQLDIKVTSSLYTKRTEFGLALTRMAVWDNRSSSVDEAYQLLSFGMQSSNDDSAANWTVKIDSLMNAGRLFEQFGMKEMRLWSSYFAAHLIQFQLRDYSIVYSMSREILAEVKGTRLRVIELASLQLQAYALIGLKQSGSLRSPSDNSDPVQSALSKIVTLAGAMGFDFEQAQALKLSGDAYMDKSAYVQALSQYQKAVKIADRVKAVVLATGIRESVVQILAIQGNIPATSVVLQEIETQLLDDGGDELALNLLAQGRLFIRSYNHLQAYEVLSQALIHQNDSAIRKQINFELARVFYASGRLDRARTYLQLADIDLDAGNRSRGNSLIDIAEGLRILANIYRIDGEFEQMRKARRAQGQHQPPLARYRYEQGLDELAPANSNIQKARSLFSQSQRAASRSDFRDLKYLALLQFCALGKPGDNQATCSGTNPNVAYNWLKSGAVPRNSAEAMTLWARILVRNGRRPEAVRVMHQLIADIHFYRHSLPGVLGSWYRERSESLFNFYLEQVIKNGANAAASLLALSKIRFIESHRDSGSPADDDAGDTELLRIQLRERADTTSPRVISSLNKSISQGLASLRAEFDEEYDSLSTRGVQAYLRGLGGDEMVLAYQINPLVARLWVAKQSGVRQLDIANPGQLYAAIQNTRDGLDNIGKSSFIRKMDALGKRLVSPIANTLTERIYLAPSGILLGIPFDALRVNGRFLVENHSIVNLTAFPANTSPADSLRGGALEKVFLAGHPQEYSSSYATRLSTSSAIQVVADIFVGPGLSIIQGAALLPDEFEGEQLLQADLVHLTMPGNIDLRDPEQSKLDLSGDEDMLERKSIGPPEIRQQALTASLVFLSATRMKGQPISDFQNRPALISDFLAAGAHSVIAGFWAGDGAATDILVADFYRNLEGSGNIASALQDAKRRYMQNNQGSGLYDWAGYQLFID